MCFCQYLLAPSCHGVWLPEIYRSRICNSVPEAGEFYPNKVFAPCRSGCQLPIYRRGCAALFVVTKPFKKVKTVQNDGWNQQILYKMTAWKSIVHQNLFKKSLHNDPNNGGEVRIDMINEFCTPFCSECAGPKRSKIKMNQHGTDTLRFLQVSHCRYLGGAVWRWRWHTSCAWWVSGRVSDVHVTYA